MVIKALFGLIFMFPTFMYFKKIMFMILDKEIVGLQILWYLLPYIVFLIVFLNLPPSNINLHFIMICLLFIFDLLHSPLAKKINDKELKGQYYDNIEKYNAVFVKNPQDWGTLSQMAYCYFKIQDYEKAIEVQKQVVKLSKGDLSERGKLSDYQKYLKSVTNPKVKCWFCGTLVDKKLSYCSKCGRSMNFADNLIKWLKDGGANELLLKMNITIGIMLGIQILLLSLNVYIRFYISMVLVAIAVFYFSYKIISKEK